MILDGKDEDQPQTLGRRALKLIARLHEEGILSEGQCCRTLAMDRIDYRSTCDQFRIEAEAA